MSNPFSIDWHSQAVKNFIIRILVSILYVCLMFICLFLGAHATAIIVACMAGICCFEFFHMQRMIGRAPNEFIGITFACLFPLAPLYRGASSLLALAFILFIVTAIWFIFKPRAHLSDVVITIVAPLYTSLLLSSVVLIRLADPGFDGMLLTFGVMGSVWVNDALAYVIGSKFGVHKLAAAISPHKSIEGFWGGIVGSILIWLILAALKVLGLNFVLALSAGLLVGFAAVLGDLFESRIKRGVGVKDSGKIIPGHGGMLDRSDSLIFATSVAYLILLFGGIL